MSGKPGAAAANAISVLMVLRDLITKAEDNCLLNFRRKGCRGQHNLEDDVILALVGFDLDLVFFVDRRPEVFHQIYIGSFSSAISSMLEELRSLQSARQFLAVIMGKNHQFIRRVLNADQTAESSKSCDHDMFPDVLQYRENVRRWKRAPAMVFDHVWKREPRKKGLRGFLYDPDRIRSILPGISEDHGSRRHGEPLYQFDLGIIIAMFLVSVGCRDKATRDSTAPLLNLNKEYREGMWGAGSAGTIISWLREVEDGMRDEMEKLRTKAGPL
ncbi:hypothetical protein BGZ57DRAFT_854176 [Hyaloscypha finlandica]|nr:hypothetical protein BGZ57DRAFT_854176 [Hyaloscypha finlandica]